MKEIKETKTIETVVGYEAMDGKRFGTKEECEKYEDSAEFVIQQDFFKVIKDNKLIPECEIFANYGYGSEEYEYAVVNIKDVNVLEIINKYLKLHDIKMVEPDRIGQNVLIEIGNLYVGYADAPRPKTIDELVHKFISDMEDKYGEKYILSEVYRDYVDKTLSYAIEYFEQDAITKREFIHRVKEVRDKVRGE